MVEALLGFGANLGDAHETVERAVAAFCDEGAVRLAARSSCYRTPPWGIAAQPEFFNVCIAIDTTLAPRALLERALAVEAMFGRDRANEIPWGPRTLDIDLLTYNHLVIDEPYLKLPHPHMLERAFVLVPLMEIRPNLTISGTPIATALARLDTRGIERLPPVSRQPPPRSPG